MWGSIAGGIGAAVGGIAGLISSGKSQANASKLNELNYQHQKEFAQNGIRWKVADAKAAGLHPLAALGASTAQYTPATAIGDSPDWSFLADAGQSIGRAVDAKRTQQERVEQQQKQDAAFALKAENQKAENDLIRAQTASIQQDMALRQAKAAEQAVRTQQQVPPMPSLAPDGSLMPGQSNATSPGGIESKPAEIVVNEPGRPGQERGSVSELGFTRTNDGGYSPVMSKDTKDRLDDDFIGSSLWHLRNSLPAAFDSERVMPPRSWLPPGTEWRFDLKRGAFYAVPAGSDFSYHFQNDMRAPREWLRKRF